MFYERSKKKDEHEYERELLNEHEREQDLS